MNNHEPFDKLIFFTKNISHNKKSEQIPDVKEKIMELMFNYIENPEDCVGTEFITPKDLTETFYFPRGNIDHMALNKGQNFEDRHFSSDLKNGFYSYHDYEDILYCGAGSYPCGSVAGTAGYMCAKQIINSN